ncbi:hypothetical protein Pcinc_012345 [Petrolisthes cinctipes]|uniref:Protein kinase domain-containing protein n=1 Tax=Petrolisthes cinctipes TaxID=88211 RepID=A0AAE1G4X6_PETCI|nr:hypothetical protein Pcinc_012345 [Petrolisthes cinctipes]
MAPEVLAGKRASVSSDLYSLAVMYYWLFSYLPRPVPRSISRELAAACSHDPSHRPNPMVLENSLKEYKARADQYQSISLSKDTTRGIKRGWSTIGECENDSKHETVLLKKQKREHSNINQPHHSLQCKNLKTTFSVDISYSTSYNPSSSSSRYVIE